MTNRVKFLGFLLLISLVALACLLATYRHEAGMAMTAKQEAAELKTRLETIDGELAALRELYNQEHDANLAASLTKNQENPADQSDVIRRMAQLEAQLLNDALIMQSLSNRLVPTVSATEAKAVRPQAIIDLNAKAAAQEGRATAAKAKLLQLMISLRVPEEIATLDTSAALGTPGLASYWPYFEAKQELEDALNFNRLLNRKIQLEELETGGNTTGFPEFSK